MLRDLSHTARACALGAVLYATILVLLVVLAVMWAVGTAFEWLRRPFRA